MIEFDRVSYRYPFADDWAVRDLSFKVAPGEVVLVTGVSGCGKTTLMRLANGLCPHYYEGELTGTVKIAGCDTREKVVGDISETVGTLFQDPEDQFFALTVRDEIGFSLKIGGMPEDQLNEEIEREAARLNLTHLLNNPISALSEGQKQRVALAEIFVTRPRALILDEPSANLDPEATQALARDLQKLKSEGFAILVVDHRLHWLAVVADRVLVMQHGRVCEEGPFNLLEDPELRRRYGLREAHVEDVRETLPSGLSGETVLQASHLTFDYRTHSTAGALSKLRKLFQSGEKAPKRPLLLSDVSFELTAGITALIGENGSGKTTLARLITGLNAGTGSLSIKGEPIEAAELMKHAGLVLQNADHQLQMRSVAEEIRACLFAAGLPREEARVSALLEAFDLLELKERHPQSLSGGQKQRLVIACALAKDPEILILDEPTSGLDGANMRRVARALNEQAALGKAVLLITHDLELLALCAQSALRMSELKSPKGVEND